MSRSRRFATAGALALAFAAGIAASLFTLPADASPTKECIYTVEGDVQAPVKVVAVPPAYPEEARKERLEGQVVVRATIDETGKVTDADIIEGNEEAFGDSAVEAIRKWTFEPATLEGEPVTVYYHLTINFKLEKEAKSSPTT